MAFTYRRTIRFADTDAAGVVFFPNYFAICHEAYEESLAAAGIELVFFGEHAVVVPRDRRARRISASAHLGDKISVTLTPTLLGPDTYAQLRIDRLGPPQKLAARLRTEHVWNSSRSRERQLSPGHLRPGFNAQSA